MIVLIVPLFINMLLIIGLNKTTAEGMVFESLGNVVRETVGEFWSKPIVSCAPCMASVHGTWFFFAFLTQPLWMWPVYVLALSGLNYLVVKNLDKE